MKGFLRSVGGAGYANRRNERREPDQARDPGPVQSRIARFINKRRHGHTQEPTTEAANDLFRITWDKQHCTERATVNRDASVKIVRQLTKETASLVREVRADCMALVKYLESLPVDAGNQVVTISKIREGGVARREHLGRFAKVIPPRSERCFAVPASIWSALAAESTS